HTVRAPLPVDALASRGPPGGGLEPASDLTATLSTKGADQASHYLNWGFKSQGRPRIGEQPGRSFQSYLEVSLRTCAVKYYFQPISRSEDGKMRSLSKKGMIKGSPAPQKRG